jgi:hypothetical protein
VVEWISAWPPAIWLQQSTTAYLLVNAAHILGIGLLVGAILPLDLRLMGCFRHAPLDVLGPFLRRSAAVGLAIAITTGLTLFSVDPAGYLANDAFVWKVVLLAMALCNIAYQYLRRKDRHVPKTTISSRVVAGISFGLWLGVLIAGRWIGFV